MQRVDDDERCHAQPEESVLDLAQISGAKDRCHNAIRALHRALAEGLRLRWHARHVPPGHEQREADIMCRATSSCCPGPP